MIPIIYTFKMKKCVYSMIYDDIKYVYTKYIKKNKK